MPANEKLPTLPDSINQSDTIILADSNRVNMDSVLDEIIKNYSNKQYMADQDNPMMYPVIVIVISVMVFAALYMYFGKAGSWQRGTFPQRLKYNKENLFEAYICLALQFFKRDTEHLKESAQFLASYLRNRFKDIIDENYYAHIIEMIPLQVSEESVIEWLQKKMPQDERIQVIDLLVDLAFFNEELTRNELIMLYRIAGKLGISISEVDSIVAIRHKRAEEARKSHVYMGKSLKEHSLKLLGLSLEATFEEVKTRYRELVKRFHPDLFSTMRQEEIDMAHERFVAINTAYQYLEEFFSKN